MKEMTSWDFVDKYILPYEDDKTYRAIKEGGEWYAEDYLLEKAKEKEIKLTDLED